MDYNLYQGVNGLSGESVLDSVFKLLANDLAGVLVVLVALTFLVPWATRRSERRKGAVLAAASAALALLINQPISHLVDRTRPYLAHPAHAHLLIARSHDPSFPSDHATGGFALAFAVWLYDRTIGSMLLVLAALLSFARVYVGTHYPGDVLAGALIGIGHGRPAVPGQADPPPHRARGRPLRRALGRRAAPRAPRARAARATDDMIPG